MVPQPNTARPVRGNMALASHRVGSALPTARRPLKSSVHTSRPASHKGAAKYGTLRAR